MQGSSLISLKTTIITLLLIVGASLALFAFQLQEKPDWPGLLINLSAGFIGAALTFVLIDVLLRGREEQAKDKARFVSELRVGEQSARQAALARLAELDGLLNADLRGINLEGLKLKAFDFSGANLTDTKFFGCDLTDTRFIASNLTDADLRGSVLTSANLHGAVLDGTDLRGAHLEGAKLTGAMFRGCDLSGANLHRATFDEEALASAKIDNIIR
jgi:uncharacterized protein YjbI with pentapeptide repeats